MVVTEEQAKMIYNEIIKVLRKHGLWYTVEEIHKPYLDMIRIKEINIKVTEAR